MRLVFSTFAYEYIAQQVCSRPDYEKGQLLRTNFSDGERLINIATDPAGKDVILLGGTIDDENTLELFDIACGLVNMGARTLCIVIPYFGYSTQERAVRSGDLVTTKARALILSAIPCARSTNEIYVFDLHTDGIAHYFEGPMLCHQIKSNRWTCALLRNIIKDDKGVVAATDAGRAKWIEKLANLAGLPAAFVYKRRTGHKTEITGVNADVSGKHVVIYDDMVRSGSSMISAAQAYKSAGAKKISAVFSHGVLPGDSAHILVNSKLFTELHTTESHPHALKAKNYGVKVHPITDLLLERLR